MCVQIKVLFFGKSREIVGKQEVLLAVPEHISYENLLKLIIEEYSLNILSNNIILAINEEYCEEHQKFILKQGDELAVIPPLSGG